MFRLVVCRMFCSVELGVVLGNAREVSGLRD